MPFNVFYMYTLYSVHVSVKQNLSLSNCSTILCWRNINITILVQKFMQMLTSTYLSVSLSHSLVTSTKEAIFHFHLHAFLLCFSCNTQKSLCAFLCIILPENELVRGDWWGGQRDLKWMVWGQEKDHGWDGWLVWGEHWMNGNWLWSRAWCLHRKETDGEQ